jgi:hypothetical protein
MIDLCNRKCSNGPVINKLYRLNHLQYHQDRSVAEALVNQATGESSAGSALLSDHTDTLCELIRGLDMNQLVVLLNQRWRKQCRVLWRKPLASSNARLQYSVVTCCNEITPNIAMSNPLQQIHRTLNSLVVRKISHSLDWVRPNSQLVAHFWIGGRRDIAYRRTIATGPPIKP